MLNAALAVLLAIAAIARWGPPSKDNERSVVMATVVIAAIGLGAWALARSHASPPREPETHVAQGASPASPNEAGEAKAIQTLKTELEGLRRDMNAGFHQLGSKPPLSPPASSASPPSSPAPPAKLTTRASIEPAGSGQRLRLELQAEPGGIRINSGHVRFCPGQAADGGCTDGKPNGDCSLDYICPSDAGLAVGDANQHRFVTIPPQLRRRTSTIMVEVEADHRRLLCRFDAVLAPSTATSRPATPRLRLTSDTARCEEPSAPAQRNAG